jgi:hypothetical protein
LDNFPKAGFIFREETSYVFTFPPPIKRFPKYEPITSQQQSTEQFAQTEEVYFIIPILFIYIF